MKKKSLILFIVFITIINIILPIVNAAQTINKANLTYDHKIDSHIQYYNTNREEWRDIQCGYICYKIDGKKYPAYCISHGLNGVDEEGPYTVTINDLLKDKLIYNTILNGYPYKTPSQLGVETNDDAYVATKHAINSVLLNRNVKTFYKAADSRGEKIINAIYNISEKGKAGNAVNKEVELSVNKIGKLVEKGEFYYQEYSVDANANISNYTIENLENFSEGCFITDTNNIKKEKFSSNQNFRVMIPKSDFNKDINGKINISASCNTCPIFYGEAPKSNIQDYAITYKPDVEYKASITLKISTDTTSIKIVKKDKETLKPIKDVIFGLYKENGECIATKKTDENGVVIFSNLYQGKYKLKEVRANENYVRDDTIYAINTEYNKQIEKVITNEHKKGNLKIIKVDKDDNNLFLESIEFDLIDSNKNKIAHLVTDKNGIATLEDINIGNYTLKETKTKQEYKLCIDKNIVVKWNKTSEYVIENEKKKGQIKVIKQDKENNEIKLEGVEFEVIDENNRIVEKIKTNSNGEAVTSRLPLGEYRIKEVSLGENNEYILDDEEYLIKVEEDKVSEIYIQNEHKKGNLKIIKVDKDDTDVTLGAIEFDLIDVNNNKIAHLVTDADGEAQINNINTGKYTLKETKTKKEYNLCVDKDLTVEWNKTSEYTIENEKKKGQIRVIKKDKDNNEIKIPNVEFEIIDKNNRIVEKIRTDSNGEAVTSKLPLGEYKIKEVSLGENLEYILSDEINIIKVEENKINEISIQNEHKKGKLKIYKIDKDNKGIPLKDVKFEIIHEDGFRYSTVTDEKGIAEVDNVRTGKVKIKEIETNKEYVLDEKEYEINIEYNKCSNITIENEKIKGQVEIYKMDKDNNEIKIPNVEFEILDKNNTVIDKLITNEKGYAISKKIPIGKYYLKEVKSNNKYLMNQETIKIEIKENIISRLNIENEKIKGKIQIIKSSSKDSAVLNITKGDYIQGVTFEIYNEENALVDSIITDEKGQALSKELEIGRYKIKEVNTTNNFILSTNEFFVSIDKDNEMKILNVENEPAIPQINIEKQGAQYAEKNKEIKYEFNIENIGNVELNNFTWKEYLPEKVKVTKMVTGLYSESIDYNIYYKTNKSDYILMKKANTCKSEYIDFDDLELTKNEKIIEIKVEYSTVSTAFKSVLNPIVYVKVEDDVKQNEKIINQTELFGFFNNKIIKDKSIYETIIKQKEIIKKLPKTGC